MKIGPSRSCSHLPAMMLVTGGLWIVGSLCHGMPPGEEVRIGVLGSTTGETQKLLPLVELYLSQLPSMVLVDRNELEKVFREQQLQALLAVDAPGKRAALGKILKADLLLFLQDAAQPNPHVNVVVCETKHGLRLCSEPVICGQKLEADAHAVIEKVKLAAKKRQQKLTAVVAIPPLLNNSLTRGEDWLQVALARVVERAVLNKPGVLVVELAEAKALAQEAAFGDGVGIKRQLPLYLMGEYRFAGFGQDRLTTFSWKLLSGDQELGQRQAEKVPFPRLTDEVREAAMALLQKPLGAKTAESWVPAVEAKQLATRATAHLAAGNWTEALGLAEASLLLNANQPAVHGDAMQAIIGIVRASRDVTKPAHLFLHDQEQLQQLRNALPHIEAFFRGTEVPYRFFHGYFDQEYEAILTAVVPKNAEETELLVSLRSEMRQTAERILATKASSKVNDASLHLVGRWTDPPKDAIDTKDATNPIKVQQLRRLFGHRLRLCEQFCYLQEGPDEPSAFEDLLNVVRRPEDLTSPAYTHFLEQTARLPNPRLRETVLAFQEVVKRKASDALQEGQGQSDYVSPAATASLESLKANATKLPEVIFHEVALKIALGDRDIPLDTTISAEIRGSKRSRGDLNYLPKVTAWIAANGFELIHVDGRLCMMKEKGRVQLLPVSVPLSSAADINGLFSHGPEREPSNFCWDGRYIWALVPGNEGPLIVIDPRQNKVLKFGPEIGLPPAKSCGVAPLGPGKVCVAGYFGRLWIGNAAFDEASKGVKLDIFHEARETPDPARLVDNTYSGLYSAQTAFPIRFFDTLTTPKAQGEGLEYRVILGRGAGAPLVILPEQRKLGVLKRVIDKLFVEEGVLYWRPDTTYPALLFRTDGRLLVEKFGVKGVFGPLIHYQGAMQAISEPQGGWHQQPSRQVYWHAPSQNGPYRALRGEVPNSCVNPMFFISRFYGLLLSTDRGLYQVELKLESSTKVTSVSTNLGY